MNFNSQNYFVGGKKLKSRPSAVGLNVVAGYNKYMGSEILLGRHLLLELIDCHLDTLNNLHLIRKAILTCAKISGSTVIAETFHKFSPQGTTGILVISESHISIHTWPEYKVAVVDFFSCNLDCDFDDIISYLKKFFRAKKVVKEVVDRSVELDRKTRHQKYG